MDVEERLWACSATWGLRIGDRLSGGFASDVFACHDEDGNERVLKLGESVREATCEAAALRAWSGRSAVPLLDFAEREAALLLERLAPGTPLPDGDDDAVLAAVAEVLRALHGGDVRGVAVPPQVIAFDQYMERAIADAEPGTVGLALLDESRDAATALCRSTRREVLLHGDVLDKNLLLHGEHFVAIDPLPRIGDPCSDVGFFAAGHQPASGIVDRAIRLADALGYDARRATQWAAVWAVGEACETWRDDSDGLQTWVASREAAELLETA